MAKKSAKTNLPQRVYVGPHVYSIVREQDIKSDEGRALWGQTRYANHQIAVDVNAPDDRAIETFFHECLHAIAATWTVRLKEREVVALSHGIVDFLKRNPDVCALYAKKSSMP